MTNEQLLKVVREIDGHAEAVVDAMQSGEVPGPEELGIAFVCADAIRDICEEVERDVLAALLAKDAA